MIANSPTRGDPSTGEERNDIVGLAVHDHHLWRTEEVAAIAADRSQPATFFCGGSRNVAMFVHLFDEVFVLVVGAAELNRRLDARPPDEWGGRGRVDERALIQRLHATGAGLPTNATLIDAEAPLSEVVDVILRRTSLAL